MTGDLDALGLRAAGSVHGFGEIADGVAAEGHVFDEAEDAAAVFDIDAGAALQVFAEEGPRVFGGEVLRGGHGGDEATGEVLREAGDLVGEAGDVVLADVGEEVVGLVIAGGGLLGFVGGGDACPVDGFVEVGHLDEFVADVGDGGDTIVVGGEGGGSDEDVADACFTDVGAAVVAGEALDEVGCESGFAIHEEQVIGDEDVVEQDHGFLPGELLVAGVGGVGFESAGVAGLATVDVGEAGVIDGDGGDDGVVAVSFAEAHGGHDQEPVGVEAAGLVHLGSADHNTVGMAFDDVDEEVGISLVGRGFGAVTFGVGHGSAQGEVFLLHVAQEGLEALVVLGAVGRVDGVGDGEEGVDGVHANAALEAGSGELAEFALHAVLGDDVGHAFGDVEKAVDVLVGERRVGGGARGVFESEIVGAGDGVDGGADDGMVDRLRDAVSHEVNAQGAVTEAFDIVGAGANHSGVPRALSYRVEVVVSSPLVARRESPSSSLPGQWYLSGANKACRAVPGAPRQRSRAFQRHPNCPPRCLPI